MSQALSWRLLKAAASGVLILGLWACAVPAARLPTGADLVTEFDESPARKRARVRLELATAYHEQGQDAVALDEVKQAIASDAAYAPAWNLRGLVYLRLGQWARAEESLQRAWALAPDADVAHNYGWLLCQPALAAARHPEAVAWFRKALAQPGYVQPARSWAALAWCQQRLGRLDDAQASVSQGLAVQPDHPRLGLMQAQLLFATGRWAPALAQVQRWQERQGSTPESLWLALRAARKLDNPVLVARLGTQLRHEFGRSPEAAAYDKGLFDE